MERRWLTDIAKDLADLGLRVLLVTGGTVLFILAAIALGAFSRPRGVCQFPEGSKARADLWAITDAIRAFQLYSGGRLPPSLEVLLEPTASGHTWLMCASIPLDPWDRPYVYEPPRESSNSFRVYCLGADGIPGGTGEDADIERLALFSR